jgi:outer membrane biosynthesis protein TonB
MRSSYRNLGAASLLSLLLHVICILLINRPSWLPAHEAEGEEPVEPLEFVLASQPEPRTVVEAPPEGEVPETVESDLLSDINSRASDPSGLPEESELPHVEGVAPVPGLEGGGEEGAPPPAVEGGEEAPGASPEKRGGEEAPETEASGEGWFPERGGERPKPGDAESPQSRPDETGEEEARPPGRGERLSSRFNSFSAPMRNPKATRAGLGEITLNTTAWDFAPYIYDLKQKIVQAWFPPYAFTALGLIYGHTKIRWRIYPDGRHERIRVVEQVGHESLENASLGAVRGAAPFEPLPPDFPEPYLEITFGFYYIVPGKNSAPVSLDR